MAHSKKNPGEVNGGRGGEHKVYRFSFWIFMVGLVIALAGGLFGYDQGVISGALKFLRQKFHLSDTLAEVVTSWVTLGALFGALAAGVLADRIGRRKAALVAAVLFSTGALIQGLATGIAIEVFGRFVVGFGVGVASVAAPLYAAEMSPPRMRGRMVSTYQLAITMGIFIAYLVDSALTQSGDWRSMFAVAAIPGALLFVGMLMVPESSRWLLKMGRREEARAAEAHLTPESELDAYLTEVEKDLSQDQTATWGEVVGKANRKALWIGLGLACFQQITGINAIIYYANEIFADAGFKTSAQQAHATLYAVGGVNVLATVFAIAFIDRLGRKPLLLAGLVGMIISLTGVGAAFLFLGETKAGAVPSHLAFLTMACLVIYIASFAFSLGPVVWTIINEIYPNRIRGRAVAVATAVNWGSAFLVSQFFLTLFDFMGKAYTFWLFALTSVAALFWIWKKVPETKGLSLEEIQVQMKASDAS